MGTTARALRYAAAYRMVPLPGLDRNLTWGRASSPIVAILLQGLICGVLMNFSFDVLVIINVLFYNVGLMLQFAAFLALKHAQPDIPRPFSVPGGLAGAWTVSLAFFSVLCLGFYAAAVSSGWSMLVLMASNTVFLVFGLAWARWGYTEGLLERVDETEKRESPSLGVSVTTTQRAVDVEEAPSATSQGCADEAPSLRGPSDASFAVPPSVSCGGSLPVSIPPVRTGSSTAAQVTDGYSECDATHSLLSADFLASASAGSCVGHSDSSVVLSQCDRDGWASEANGPRDSRLSSACSAERPQSPRWQPNTSGVDTCNSGSCRAENHVTPAGLNLALSGSSNGSD